MRIGMMADAYKPHISGITNYIDLNKRHLERAGHEVFVFTFGDLEHQDGEPRVIRSPGLPLQDTGYYLSFRYSREAKRLLQTMDILHVHHPFLSGRLALRYARPLQIPIVFTNHTRYDLYAQAYLPMMPEEISDGLLKAYMPSFCAAVDLVIAPSAGMEKILRQLEVESPIEVVPNGVELDRYLNAQPLPRADFGFAEQDILFVYVGRLAPEKNMELLLRAFHAVAESFDHARLLILGDGPAREELETLASELGLSERARFAGMIPYDALPAHLAMCDVFATASVTEVHPLSVIEAMGAGLPVLGIHSPGVSDTVVDGVTGFLSNEDTAAFAVKMTRLVMDSGLRKRMGAASREESTKYAIERTTRMMLRYYETLVSESLPRHQGFRFRIRSFLEQFKG
ncbi:MAG: Alpha-monoglucosyldiacylglycerol synthase [Anaerolineales bacterium]|nr:Alpha-monoglucosyldiacylglycerol synthase [Anaerolineales bacterium]